MVASEHMPDLENPRAHDPVFALHGGGKMEIALDASPLNGPEDLSLAYTPGVARVCEAIAERPSRWPHDYTWVSQHGRGRHRRHRGARARRHRPAGRDAGDGGQGRAVQAVRRRRRRADLPGHHRRRRDRRDRRRGWRRASAASTSRTSPRRAASRSRTGSSSGWTSRSSTTTSTAPRSSCSPRCATRCGSPGALTETSRVVISGAGAAGVAVAKILLAAGVARRRRRRPQGVLHSGRGDLNDCQAGAGRGHRRPAPDAAGSLADALRRRGRLHRRLRRHGARGGRRRDGRRRDHLRAGQPDTRRCTPTSPTGTRAVVATGRSDFPNQINNVLAFPGIFRGAFDARATRDHRGHEARRGRGARRRRRRRPAPRTS